MTVNRQFVTCAAVLLATLGSMAIVYAEPPLRLRRPAVARASSKTQAAPRHLKLVQFGAPPTDQDLNALALAGAEIVQYVPQNAYLVWAPEQSSDTLGRAVGRRSRSAVVQSADFQPHHALAPALDDAVAQNRTVTVTVQLYAGSNTTKRDLRSIRRRAVRMLKKPRGAVGGRFLNVRIEARGKNIEEIAGLPSVVNVEPYVVPRLHGERQAQILADDLDGLGQSPASPGYLSWLAAQGFSTSPSDYPVTVVVDDGVDDGSTEPVNSEFREQNSPAGASRIAFAVVPPGSGTVSAEGPDGHGNINASIIAGFNDSIGAAFEDADGFQYGLGISPYGRLGNVRIFAPDYDDGSGTAQMVEDYYSRGARLSSNSWGVDVEGLYTAEAQQYDTLTRDAGALTPGNQELLFVFSAGNAGLSSGTIGAPGTAKNVLTVGASESFDPAASAGDGCGLRPGNCDDVRDMASFSSRGPCADGRMKPDIVAPGTFIHGAASRPSFNGSTVCGASSNDFVAPGGDALFPSGTMYTWSSGTSHSAAAIAGYASLIQEFLARVYGRLDPSPALQKAYVIHSGTHLAGVGANEDLPGKNQGFGRANMAMGFDTSAPRLIVDQELLLTDSGEVSTFGGTVVNAAAPIRIALVWTDAPGAPFADAYVNDLDLIVEFAGNTYRGNNFIGGISQSGGVADPRNNVEAVFLPSGATGPITIRVEGTVIAGDGVPGNLDVTDQDFALVAYNIAAAGSFLSTDRSAYRCTDVLNVTLFDGGMTGAGVIGLSVTSDGGDDETVSAAETAPGSGLFTAAVPISEGAAVTGSDALEVAHGQLVTVRYDDSDDGSGAPASFSTTVEIDCLPPVLSGIDALAGLGRATLMATSNEPARLRARVGTSCDALSLSETESGPLALSHALSVRPLEPFSEYQFVVDAFDAAGNEITVDNGGACFSFATDIVRTFNVNSTADQVDVLPGDGVCSDAAGSCTLRAAIQEANAAPGADEVILAAKRYPLRIAGSGEDVAATGDLDILDDIVIAGAGAADTVINGRRLDRIFDVHGEVTGFVSDLTVRGGEAYYSGGGIANHENATLTLERVRVVSNIGFLGGGGIFSSGVLTISDSSVDRNKTDWDGGGIENYGSATIDRSTIRRNRADDGHGGGLYNYYRMATLEHVSITHNRSAFDGGGIAGVGSELMITNGTLAYNRAGGLRRPYGDPDMDLEYYDGNGGGLSVLGDDVLLEGVTIAGNRAFGNGGGIENYGGTVVISNSTIWRNRADGDYYGYGGGINHQASKTTLINVTVANNRAEEGHQVWCGVDDECIMVNTLISGLADDCVADGVSSLGHNLGDDGSCNLTQPSDVNYANPRLSGLRDNGGSTRTSGLRPTSPAIDAGDPAACPSADQRGVARPQGSACDIGAFEVEQP